MIRRSILLLLAASVYAIVNAVPAGAFVTAIVATSGDTAAKSYTTPVVVAPVGGPLTFQNWDVQPHNVESDETGDGSQPWCGLREYEGKPCPLFWSPFPQAGGGPALPVQGIDKLVSGTVYTFHCHIHTGMVGRLIAV